MADGRAVDISAREAIGEAELGLCGSHNGVALTRSGRQRARDCCRSPVGWEADERNGGHDDHREDQRQHRAGRPKPARRTVARGKPPNGAAPIAGHAEFGVPPQVSYQSGGTAIEVNSLSSRITDLYAWSVAMATDRAYLQGVRRDRAIRRESS